MPHCSLGLYDNLLWANWGPDTLAHIILFGNRFSGYVERDIGRRLRRRAGYVAAAAELCTEECVANKFTPPVVFNDLAFHWFTQEALAAAEPTVWADAAEPDPTNHPELYAG